VYATSVSTALFFAQAIGRFVRARRRGETASVFLPSVPTLMSHASEMETERDHVLDRKVREDGLDDDLIEEANRKRDNPDVGEELPFETVEASAHFDRVVFDGGEFGMGAAPGSAEEEDYLGIPGLLEPEQVTSLLKQRQAEQLAAQRKEKKAGTAKPDDRTAAEDLHALRKELNGLVGAWHHRTGQPHGVIHAELRRVCGGPPSAQASGEDVRKRIAKVREWAARPVPRTRD
jgi:superfamily II DNA or RNA helicase